MRRTSNGGDQSRVGSGALRVGIDARFLTHPQPGGFKTYTTNLVRALACLESDIDLVVYVDRDPAKSGLPEAPHIRYRVVDGSVPLVGMPWREQVALPRMLRHDRIVLAHFLCNTAPLACPTPYVLTLHDTIQVTERVPAHWSSGLSGQVRRAVAAYSRWCIRRVSPAAMQVITVSRFEADQITRMLGVPTAHISVVYPAPDPGFASVAPPARVALQTDLPKRLALPDRFALAVGYEPRKNIPFLIRTFARLPPTMPGLVVVCANEASRDQLSTMVREEGAENRIVVLGKTSFSDLVGLYNIARMFLFPSEREGFGLPPLEAMACGTPTVALASPAVAEVVGDGGVLLPSLEMSSWLDAVERLERDQDFRTGVVRRGTARAATFSWARCAEQTLATYRLACESAPMRLSA
ncbi:MAG: glycosyltransferase family 4 protein [Vicinamibacterales bacterium]